MKEITHATLSILGGSIAFMVGGFNTLFTSLVMLCLLDITLSALKHFKEQKFSYNLFLWGFVNKMVVILVVMAINFIQKAMQLPIPIRESAIMLLMINEFLSNLRNASSFVSGLEPIIKFFEGVKLNILKIFKVDDNNG